MDISELLQPFNVKPNRPCDLIQIIFLTNLCGMRKLIRQFDSLEIQWFLDDWSEPWSEIRQIYCSFIYYPNKRAALVGDFRI